MGGRDGDVGDYEVVEMEMTVPVPMEVDAPQLLNLIEIKSDKQELSFVEKVVLSRANILELFHSVAPGSLKSSTSGRWVLDATVLEQSTVDIVGLYGNKRIMAEVLAQDGILLPGEDSLPAGLYGALLQEKLLLFYWPPVKKFVEARRGDISCNFIRYLLELCNTVYCCMEVEDGSVEVSSMAPVATKKKRTQRLQISIVKSSENDFLVYPGFTLELPKFAKLFFGWSDGLHRSAYLVEEKYTPKKCLKSDQLTVSVSDLPSLVKKWEDFNIDIRKLNDEDLILFAESAKLEGFDALKEDLRRLDEETAGEERKLSNSEDYLEARKKDVLQVLAEGLNAYLRLYYPWEESVYSNWRGEVRIAGASIVDFLDYTESAGPYSPKLDKQTVESVTSSLVKVLKNDDAKMIFVGSKVCIRLRNKQVTYVIKQAGGRKVGPVFYDETLSVTNMKGKSFEVKLTNGVGVVLSTDRFNLGWGGWWMSWKSETDVKFMNVWPATENDFEAWISSYAGEITKLEKKAAVADFVLYHKAELGLDDDDDDDNALFQCIVADDEQFTFLEQVETCKDKWNELVNTDGPYPLGRAEIATWCAEIYGDGRRKFLSSIFECLEEPFGKFLKEHVASELKAQRADLGLASKEKKHNALAAFRANFSKARQSKSPDVILQQCRSTTYHNNSLKISFMKEEVQNERVSWTAVELLPMKKDVDAQLQTPGRLITPCCSGSKQVVDMDSTEYKLAKVVLLKSGNVLVFLRRIDSSLEIHCCSLGSRLTIPGGKKPVYKLNRGSDLFCFDEASQFIAFYDSSSTAIKVYRFLESSGELHWNGVNIVFSSYCGHSRITWMEFVPGKEELLVVDDTLCVRVFEAVIPGMMKSRAVQLPPYSELCLTTDGLCLIALCGDHKEENLVALSAEVYKLDGSLEKLKTVDLGLSVESLEGLKVSVASFGTQMHLLVYTPTRPELIRSVVLEVKVSSQSCHLQRSNNVQPDAVAEVGKKTSCHELDYLYHVFDKYAVSPPLLELARSVQFGLVVDVLKGEYATVEMQLVAHAEAVLKQLRRDKGKDFSQMKISFDFQLFTDQVKIQSSKRHSGDLLRHLMCLVPVQIARAQNNSLRPLVDGLEMPSEMSYGDAVQLAEILRFGVYDAVLESWTGPVKVISSMGKQSSGKSYLLNHLSGSVLDVAGGRCTDGVWMTCRATEECLYVILDFEGLGSFERSEQEDMLLSILNAAISNITIFNKKDFHLDKETEAVFERFQNGVSLVKDDSKLFKGLFYMAIKDVDAADVDELKEEFSSKIVHICNKSQDNFLTRMYGGQVEVAAMPPFNRPEFHESVAQIAETVESLDVVHGSGKSFLRDMKLVISQICSKDWSPIDTKRIAFKASMLRRHLKSAIALGSLAYSDRRKLVNFDTEEEIGDAYLSLNSHTFELQDTGLQLSVYEESDVMSTVLEQLVFELEKTVPRSGSGKADERWFVSLEEFLFALVDRRKVRVLQWIDVNTAEFSSDGDVQKLVLEATSMAAGVKDKLALCSCKCEQCFLHCILQKSHPGKHSCKGNHRCQEICSYCEESSSSQGKRCSDKAGHEGLHDCKVKSHTCREQCCLFGKSTNCNKTCSLKAGHHDQEHMCNSRQHMCQMKCSLPSCNNTCVYPAELVNHGSHVCHEKMCIMQCQMDGCNRKCATEDHFHSLKDGVLHICGNEHQCMAKCESRGNCGVITEVSRRTQTYVGKRSIFQYDHVSEQNGVRKECCIPIPAMQVRHAGPHVHSVRSDCVHFCEVKCQGCGYFCNLPIDHGGLHDTTHGNMTQRSFVSESEEVDIDGRKYEWGESGAAEMCMMHCKAQGHGHVHLVVCEKHKSGSGVCGQMKVAKGVRHATKRYGPDFHVPKDEFTHAAYWKNMRFKDPCSDEDQKQFALCGNFCGSTEHNSNAGSLQAAKSYCTEELWHAPVARTAGNAGTGYVTEDGHHFACNHSRDIASHVIFVADKSGSMDSQDIQPKLAKFPQNRLGCVYEAMLRFIRTRRAANLQDSMSVVLFDTSGVVAMERQAMSEDQLDKLLAYSANGGTTYSSGLQRVEQVLTRALGDNSGMGHAPTVIFLSDGGNNGGMDPVYFVNRLKNVEPRLVFHTIMFGNDPAHQILKNMAAAGNGVFQVSLDELQLARDFEGLAKSLRSKVAALM